MNGDGVVTLVGKHGRYSYKSGLNPNQGGNGYVFDLIDNDEAVVKVFKNFGYNKLIRLERFNKEIEFLEKHNGDNVHLPVFIDSYVDCQEQPFIVMKKYRTIDQLYDKKLSPKALLEICLQLIDVIEYIHSTGTAHRDIKPRNLLFEHDRTSDKYRLILTDYGLIGDDEDSNGDAMGSSSFTPPELSDRTINSDNYYASDIYEFVKTVYSLLKGDIKSFSDGIYFIGLENEIKLYSSNRFLFIEPIYEMIEKGIKYSMEERLGLNECRDYIAEAIELIDSPDSKKWIDRRNKRRTFASFINASNSIIKDQDKIFRFMSDFIKDDYDLGTDYEKVIVDGVERKIRLDPLTNKKLCVYTFCFNGTKSYLNLEIKELIVINEKDTLFEINARVLNSNYIGSNSLIKYRLVEKEKGVFTNSFTLTKK